VKEDEMGRECSLHVENMNAYRILLGNSERKTPLEIPIPRWEDNIKVDQRQIVWGGVD
jgi:hypothetical protein